MAASSTLEKNLTLFDVYAISTGAMFSSGFFLLPGIAAAEAGPSAILAYLVAGILILPPMFSMAELATAMPKAGGAYYFLDRSLGPLAGTVGGLGTWLALVFKSAFALIGMGAYLAIFFDVPIKPLAAALTVAFATLNVVGAKETTVLQRVLVTILVAVLVFYLVQGFLAVSGQSASATRDQLVPAFPFGATGFVSTIGLVFVSYAGLTKVASVAEEVENPDRNIPLGMVLSLLTATAIYVLGVFVMVTMLDAEALRSDLTPVATSGELFMDWLPEPAGLILIVIAAIAAFASTGNAGILSASRYPLAMARDRLVPSNFATLGRFGTPTQSILATAGLMLLIIFGLSEEGVAKLASAFQLLIFALLNLAVIIMRESGIPSYAPGYRSPLYPWMQAAGIVIAVLLIAEMGNLSILFTAAIVVAGIGWYFYYAQQYVGREGAIYHLFARLGKFRYDALDSELHTILKEKGAGDDSRFEKLVGRASVFRVNEPRPYDEVVTEVADLFAARTDLSPETIKHGFLEGSQHGGTSVAHGTAQPYFLASGLDREELVLVQCRSGLCVDFDPEGERDVDPVYAFFFLLSPKSDQNQHLRTQAILANRAEEETFLTDWRGASDEKELKEVLLHHERYLSLSLLSGTPTEGLIDQRVTDLDLPTGNLVALIRREGHTIIPSGSTHLREGDQVTIIGDPAGIDRMYELHRQGEREGVVE